MISNCIICNVAGSPIVRNGIAMRLCPDCGLFWIEDPKPMADYYHDRDTNCEEGKIEDRISNSRDRLHIIKKYIPADDLCDVGCGEGMFLHVARQQGYRNLSGLEPNEKAVAFAKNDGLNVFQGVLEDLTLLIKRHNLFFKTITMFHVIEHLSNPANSLKMIHDTLPARGYLILETPDSRGYSLKKTSFRHKLVYSDHLYYFNSDNLQKLLNLSGFKIIVSGQRDFNQWHLPPREIAFRLFGRKINNSRTKEITNSDTGSVIKPEKNYFRRSFSNFISRILSPIVIISRRLDYQWVIAQKIS